MTDLTTGYVYNVTSKKISTVIKGTHEQICEYVESNFDSDKYGMTIGNDYTNCGNDSLSYATKVKTINL